LVASAVERQVFVISDLHIGSGGPRDTLDSLDKRHLVESFLNHVQREDGELIILGDMIDLWRFGLMAVVRTHRELLDHLNEMNVTYIPGNHDQVLGSLQHPGGIIHPFFDKLASPCTRQIGSRQFHFMHGHELDPINGRIGPNIGKALGLSAGLIEWAKGAQVFSSEVIGEAMLELGERVLAHYYALTHGIKRHLGCGSHGHCDMADRTPLKTQHERNMLRRHNNSRLANGHDVVISAHTHRPGVFSDWYYNSGSWTSDASTFLRITPDAVTKLFDWTNFGPRPNDATLCSMTHQLPGEGGGQCHLIDELYATALS
jgi:UDP-2,3-diacylglucosamine pyrophosphatase LpxH